jgi:hypothetical protein
VSERKWKREKESSEAVQEDETSVPLTESLQASGITAVRTRNTNLHATSSPFHTPYFNPAIFSPETQHYENS